MSIFSESLSSGCWSRCSRSAASAASGSRQDHKHVRPVRGGHELRPFESTRFQARTPIDGGGFHGVAGGYTLWRPHGH